MSRPDPAAARPRHAPKAIASGAGGAGLLLADDLLVLFGEAEAALPVEAQVCLGGPAEPTGFCRHVAGAPGAGAWTVGPWAVRRGSPACRRGPRPGDRPCPGGRPGRRPALAAAAPRTPRSASDAVGAAPHRIRSGCRHDLRLPGHGAYRWPGRRTDPAAPRTGVPPRTSRACRRAARISRGAGRAGMRRSAGPGLVRTSAFGRGRRRLRRASRGSGERFGCARGDPHDDRHVPARRRAGARGRHRRLRAYRRRHRPRAGAGGAFGRWPALLPAGGQPGPSDRARASGGHACTCGGCCRS